MARQNSKASMKKKAALAMAAGMAGVAIMPSAAHAGLSFTLKWGDGTTTPKTAAVGTPQVQLWATLTGTSATSTDEAFVNGYVTLVSSEVNGGAVSTGALANGTVLTNFTSAGSANGGGQEISTVADQVGDWGSTSTATNDSNYMLIRPTTAVAAGGATGDSVASNPAVWEFEVATWNLNITSLVGSPQSGAQTVITVQKPGFTGGGSHPSYDQATIDTVTQKDNSGTAYGSSLVLTAPAGNNTPTAGKIISLTAGSAAASGYGVNITQGSGTDKGSFNPTPNVLTVAGGAGNYFPAYVDTINAGAGAATDSVKVTGFTGGDTEILYLKLAGLSSNSTVAAGQINTIIADINAATDLGAQDAAIATGIPASNGYQIQLSFSSSLGGGTNDLGFDFTQEPTVTGVTVVAVEAIPEPTSAAVAGVGGLMLLSSRRRRNQSK